MPNLEPTGQTFQNMKTEKTEYAYGSRQKRIENFNALVEFLEVWKDRSLENGTYSDEKAQATAERFCNMNFQYGYVSRNDIVQQAIMKVGLL